MSTKRKTKLTFAEMPRDYTGLCGMTGAPGFKNEHPISWRKMGENGVKKREILLRNYHCYNTLRTQC